MHKTKLMIVAWTLFMFPCPENEGKEYMSVCMHLCVSSRTISCVWGWVDLQPLIFFPSYTISFDGHLSLLIMQMVWGSDIKDPWNSLFSNLYTVVKRTDYWKLGTISLGSQEKTKDWIPKSSDIKRDLRILKQRENAQRKRKGPAWERHTIPVAYKPKPRADVSCWSRPTTRSRRTQPGDPVLHGENHRVEPGGPCGLFLQPACRS